MNNLLRLLSTGLVAAVLVSATVPARAGMHLAGADGGSAIASSQPPTATKQVKQADGFSDVSDDYWAKPFIDALAADGYVSGYDDGNFRPDQQLTRAEFCGLCSPRRLPIRLKSSQPLRPLPMSAVSSGRCLRLTLLNLADL